MDFYQETSHRAGEYSNEIVTERKPTGIHQALHNLSYNNEYALYVTTTFDNDSEHTTKVICLEHKSILCKHCSKTHIMALDCDSEFDMLSAARILKVSEIGYAIIKSNGADKNRYWIITDFVGDIDKVIEKMSNIPGVDSKYVHYCASQRTMYLRAYHKIVDYKVRAAVFPDTHGLTNPIVIKWYDEFKAHMESKELRVAAVTRMLRMARDNNVMQSVVSDPQFEI